MSLILDPLFYVVAVPAVLLSGISKGGFGSAVGGMGVPLMALAVSPPQAAPQYVQRDELRRERPLTKQE